MFDENRIRINKGLDKDFDLDQFQSEFVYFDVNNSNVVYYNSIIFGFYNVKKIECDNLITIEYALVKRFRGYNIGQEFLHIIVNKVLKENSEYEKVVLMIKYSNTASKKVAQKEQFSIDIDLMERLSEEISDYVPYSKRNKYYENKKFCLQK